MGKMCQCPWSLVDAKGFCVSDVDGPHKGCGLETERYEFCTLCKTLVRDGHHLCAECSYDVLCRAQRVGERLLAK